MFLAATTSCGVSPEIVKSKLKSILILIIGGLLALWFVSSLDWREVSRQLASARMWPLAIAAGLIILTLLLRSLRWQVFLEPLAKVTLAHTFVATSIGFGSVFIFGRAGEIVRPLVLSLRERIRPSVTIATILIERVFDMSAVAFMFAINLLFFAPPPGSTIDSVTLQRIHLTGILMTIGVCIGIGVLVLFRAKAAVAVSLLDRLLGWAPSALRRAVVNLISHLGEGLRVLTSTRELMLSAFYTVLVWTAVTAATWLVAFAFRLDLSLSSTIFVLGFGLVGSLVPTPGGSAGAFHAAAAAGLIVLGIGRNLAGSISIVLHFIAFGSPFLIGLFFIVRDGLGLGGLRELMSSAESEEVSNNAGSVSHPTNRTTT